MRPLPLCRCALAALIVLSVAGCGAAPMVVPTAAVTPGAVAAAAPPAMAPAQDTVTPVSTATPAALPAPIATPTPSTTATAKPTASAPATVTATRVLPTAAPAAQWLPATAGAEERLSRYNSGILGVLVERSFYSPALDQIMPYDIYLPARYDSSAQRYPVLYMLHGGGGHRDEWPGYGLVDVADQEFRSGSLLPMIIVFPQGDTGYWTDNANGGPRWGQYLWCDVVGHIDAAYRTLPSPQSRAVGGVSMGGWGALSNTFLHPDVFGVAGAHSPSLPLDDGTRRILGAGEEYKRKDPVTLAATAPQINGVRIWIDAGDADSWLPRVNEVHNALASRGIGHIWQINSGVHDYTYWMKHALEYLQFYSGALARE